MAKKQSHLEAYRCPLQRKVPLRCCFCCHKSVILTNSASKRHPFGCSYDFFLLGGDDMWFIVENLRAYLGTPSTSSQLCMGIYTYIRMIYVHVRIRVCGDHCGEGRGEGSLHRAAVFPARTARFQQWWCGCDSGPCCASGNQRCLK